VRQLIRNFDASGGVRLGGYRAVRLSASHPGTGRRTLTAESADTGSAMSLDVTSVILADGGFQADSEMLKAYSGVKAPERCVTRGAGTGRGDCARIAVAAGGEIVDPEALYAHVLHRDALDKANDDLIYFPVLDHLVDVGVVVDGEGRRFLDERLGGVAAANRIARLADPAGTWLIFDQAGWDSHARGANQIVPPDPNLLMAGAPIVAAITIGELAASLDVPTPNLEASLAATRVRDPDARTAVLTPPYFAAPLAVGITSTMGGVAVDADANVTTPAGEKIRDIFAAGACVGGLSGGPIPGYVAGLSVAATLGIIAAEGAYERAKGAEGS
jgi:succinate dehydrogenase/fumarate reductase flavoprotein subunit